MNVLQGGKIRYTAATRHRFYVMCVFFWLSLYLTVVTWVFGEVDTTDSDKWYGY